VFNKQNFFVNNNLKTLEAIKILKIKILNNKKRNKIKKRLLNIFNSVKLML
jgi:hypothetical protein